MSSLAFGCVGMGSLTGELICDINFSGKVHNLFGATIAFTNLNRSPCEPTPIL